MSTLENGAIVKNATELSAEYTKNQKIEINTLGISNSDTVLSRGQTGAETFSKSTSSTTYNPSSNLPYIKKTPDNINKISFEDNILSKYNSATYNFRFFMTTEAAAYETLPHENIIIIAETGSTGLNITDVTIDTIIAPSTKTTNTFATSVTIKIIEPFGVSLLDYIRNSAEELGIRDHRVAPLWLDLRFKGYTPGDNNSYEGGEPIELTKQTRTWSLRVKNIDIEMTSGGTEYNIQCIAQDEASLEDSARRIESKIHIRADTLGEFFEKLVERLNKFTDFATTIQEDKVESVRRYKITMPDQPLPDISNAKRQPGSYRQMRNWKIRGEKRVGTVRTESSGAHNVGGLKWETSFESGTSIEQIIQQIIGSTQEGQSLALFGEVGRKIDSANNMRDPTKPSIIFVIDPTVKILSYNEIAKAYNIEITYNIKHYETYIPINDREHIKSAKSSEKSKDRLYEKMRISNIKKKYNYMFTGENTEILDYKIELNSTWFVSLPIFRGQNRNTQAFQGKTGSGEPTTAGGIAGQVREDKSKVTAESIQELRKKVERQEALLNSKSLSQYERENIKTVANQQQIDKANLSELERKALLKTDVKLLPSQTSLNTLSWSEEEKTKRINLTNDNIIYKSSAVDPRLNVNNNDIRGSMFFAEDFGRLVDTSSQQNKQKSRNSVIDLSSLASPIASPPGGENNIEGTKDSDRSFFSSIMNQTYGFKGSLIDLDLEIKGDPYWLGEPNPVKRLTTKTGFDDLTNTDSLLLLVFKFPVAVGDGGDILRDEAYNGTGLYDLRIKENGFNGIYTIISVENSFSNGKFIQRLKGIIDPLTEEQVLINELDKIENT